MSEFRNSVILLVVCLGLYGFLALGTDIDDLQDLDRPRKLTRFEVSDLTRVAIWTEEASYELVREVTDEEVADDAARAREEAGTWTLVLGERSLETDRAAVEEILRRVSGLEVQRTVDLEGQDLSPYELDEPGGRVRWEAPTAEREAEREGAVLIGGRSPVGALKYLRLEGRSPVYAANSWDLEILTKAPSHFREKQVLRDLTFDELVRIRVELRDRDVTRVFERADEEDGARWRIVAPAPYPAAEGELRSLVFDLRSLRAQSFLPEDPALREPYQLDEPNFVVHLEGEEGKSWELRVGARAPDKPNRVGAYVPARDEAVTVAADLLQRLSAPLTDFRVKEVFLAGLREPSRLEVAEGDARAVAERRGPAWAVPMEEGAEPSLLTTTVGRVIDELDKLVVSTFHDEPTAPMTAAFEEGDPLYFSVRHAHGETAMRVALGGGTEHTWLRREGETRILEVRNRRFVEALRGFLADPTGVDGGGDTPRPPAPGGEDGAP